MPSYETPSMNSEQVVEACNYSSARHVFIKQDSELEMESESFTFRERTFLCVNSQTHVQEQMC